MGTFTSSVGGGGTQIVVLTAYKNGTWNIAMSGKESCKGTYTGDLDSDGTIDIKITHEIQDASGELKPYDPPKNLTATISENGSKMSFTYAAQPLVLTKN